MSKQDWVKKAELQFTGDHCPPKYSCNGTWDYYLEGYLAGCRDMNDAAAEIAKHKEDSARVAHGRFASRSIWKRIRSMMGEEEKEK